MEWFTTAIKGLVGGNSPTTEERVQQHRDDSFKRQQGIQNQLAIIRNELTPLRIKFEQTPASDQVTCERLFIRIRQLEDQEQALNNTLILLQKASNNMNTTQSTMDTVKTIHESNQLVDNIVKENRKVMGATPETIMNRMRTTNEKTDNLTNLIAESATSINQASLDQYTTQKKDMASDMARYRASLANESSLAKRTQVLNSMPQTLPPIVTPLPEYTTTAAVKSTSSVSSNPDPWVLFTQDSH